MTRQTTAAAAVLGASVLLGSIAVGAGVSAAASGSTAKSGGVTISLRSTSHGKVLVGKGGLSIYDFAKDSKNDSRCGGGCQSTWPPVSSKGVHAGHGVKASHLGHTSKGQATYYGRPLYYYAGDSKAGQTHGENADQFGAKWYLVNAKGKSVH